MSTGAKMEYTTIWIHWTNYFELCDDPLNEKNFEKNMAHFNEYVNGAIGKGWQPHGPPHFSAGWYYGCIFSGSAVQCMIRDVESGH